MDDLISRQAAIDALRSCQTYLFDAEDPDKKIELRSAELVIKDLPAVQPDHDADVSKKAGWIPCSERPPNHDEYIKNNGLFIVSDGNRSYSEWYDIYDKRRFGEPTMSGFRIDYAVTAWKSLPEPYKGGDE